MQLGLISLGCAKNKVDSEIFLGMARKYGLLITDSLDEADVIVVNTCGFIEEAKKESIDTLVDLIDYAKSGKVIVAIGCLVERYLDELKNELPEVNYFIPIRSYQELPVLFKRLTNLSADYEFSYKTRELSTPPSTAYLRIGEGCNNCCSYCAIPLIRGSYRSRPLDELMDEAKLLIKMGVEELTIIAQDTSKYGSDLKDTTIATLLTNLAELKAFKWIRVLYLYPDEITDELIEVFKKYDCILNYFDIPIQHASNKLLKAMNRRGTKEDITLLIDKIRTNIPDSIIRTTLIVGFPGETNGDFLVLKKFISDMKFSHLGVFTYSDEENTKAFDMYPKVRLSTMEKRRDELMQIQLDINIKRLSLLVGKTFEALCDHYDPELNAFALRYYVQALDDVDGYIYTSSSNLIIGAFYMVKITGVDGYDLIGEVLN
ncbi:MAG: 30S ribosomal protein S12 methylthiotransferase RimO [Bacilli bacterium]|nr:30S ribosomal protein S12 methylthiotransferase RimO [Bacilli bacterium]